MYNYVFLRNVHELTTPLSCCWYPRPLSLSSLADSQALQHDPQHTAKTGLPEPQTTNLLSGEASHCISFLYHQGEKRERG